MQTMIVDQLVFAPAIITTFFVSTSLMEGKSVPEVKQKLDRDLLTAVKGNYLLWPAAQLINFSLVPTKLAVLYVSNVALIWNTYICWLSNREDSVPADKV
jgi:protein Mpv17